MFLKPLSAAIAIGTGGPFGAEGPIIATGGALGSLVGQLIHVTADERKTLLAAGAAAGMAATFGSPVSAVLARDRAAALRVPPALAHPRRARRGRGDGRARRVRRHGAGLRDADAASAVAPGAGVYVLLGAIDRPRLGVRDARRLRIEDLFEELPIHWMWWPAIGAVAVGVDRLVDQRTLGVGYDNIEHILERPGHRARRSSC